MSVVQTLFYHLIDPLLITLALLSSLTPLPVNMSSIKIRLLIAFTIGLIIELIFVSQHEGQGVSLFTLGLGAVAAYLWLVVGLRLRATFSRFKNRP